MPQATRHQMAAFTLVALFVAVGAALRAQSEPKPALRFEVASVKPGGAARGGGPPVSGRLIAQGATVEGLIIRAYGIRPFQLEGGPSWVRSESFDISAKAPTDSVTEAEMFEMVRHLLADRFGLRVRVETRQAPVYKLRLARTDGRFGAGLNRATPECEKTINARKQTGAQAQGSAGPVDPSRPVCGVSFMSPVAGNAGLRLTMGGMPLSQLQQRITNDLAAPVVDETGLTGLFDIVLEYERFGRTAGAPTDVSDPNGEPPPPPLQAALQQQLGLKLERETGPVPVVVIEAIQRPTPD
jgi:uncharacterized protein (TIGR03435 family)